MREGYEKGYEEGRELESKRQNMECDRLQNL